MDNQKLIDEWLLYAEASPANQRLDELTDVEPEKAWPIILRILDRTADKHAYALLAAGALEDLLAKHGNQFIERVEAEARNNPKFKMLLGGVWQNSMTTEIWERVKKARENIAW